MKPAKKRLRKALVWIWSSTAPAPTAGSSAARVKPSQTLRGSQIRVLMLKTTAQRGGAWHPVTGGVDRGERFRSGALREAIEETGLSFDEPPHPLGFECRFVGRWGAALEKAYALRAIDGLPKPRLDRTEHTRSAWMTLAEAAELLEFPDQKKSLALLKKKIADKKSL